MTVMKIGLVCPYNMFDKAGGVQEQVIHIYSNLEKRGHHVKIITPRPFGYEGPVAPKFILLGTSRRVRAGLATSGDLALEIDGDEIKTVLEDEKFDLINFHEPWIPVLARQIIQRSDAAHVGTFHAALVDTIAAKSVVNLMTSYGRGISNKLHILTAVSPAASAAMISKAPEL